MKISKLKIRTTHCCQKVQTEAATNSKTPLDPFPFRHLLFPCLLLSYLQRRTLWKALAGALAASFVVLCPICTRAQSTPAQTDPDIPMPARPIPAGSTGASLPTRPAPILKTLPTGVRLLLQKEPEASGVAIVLFVRMEQDDSPADRAAGLLVASALFGGHADRGYNGVAELAYELGGPLETLHTPQYIAVTCLTTAAQIPTAAHLLCDSVVKADFASEALDRARKAIRQERMRRDADVFEREYTYAVGNLRGETEPSEAQLARVTQAQAQAYFRARYLPDRTVISVAGNFDPESVIRSFRVDCADYDRRPLHYPNYAPPAQEPSSKNSPIASVECGTPNATGYAFAVGDAPTVDSSDFPAFMVLNVLLGQGHASRLFAQVRERLGVGYRVGTEYRVDRAEPLVAYLDWKRPAESTEGEASAQAAKLRDLLLAQFDALQKAPANESELERARNHAIGREMLRHERLRERAFLPGWYETMGLGFGFDAALHDLLARVTAADIQRVARKYLTRPASLTTIPTTAARALP